MRAISGNIYAKLNVKTAISLGSITDVNVNRLEQLVANYYGVNVSGLNDWRNDSEAKKMVCFLLHHHLHYSIGSIAKVYNINRLYLRDCIVNEYINCLQNPEKKAIADGFIKRLTSKDIGSKTTD
jgi:hypothetical protein